MELKFRKNGKLKLLIIADAQDTDTPQRETTDIIRNSIRTSSPDLIILLGDNIAGNFDGVTPEKTKEAVKKVLEPICEKKLPFALVFGNHDHEGLKNRCGFGEKEAKEFILEEFMRYPGCLAVKGEPESGVGTYNLPVKSSDGSKTVFNLWLMDSGTYDDNGGYGFVQPDQTEWYINTSEQLKAENGGVPVPSFLFQHIPVPETYRLTKPYPVYVPGSVKGSTKLFQKFYKGYKNRQGSFREAPCCSNTVHHQLDTWKKQGDILCAFFGHDHTNDYLGEVDGIDLCAVPAAGYYSYGWHHGARTVTVYENDIKNYSTQILSEKELLPYKVLPGFKQRHGYCEYKNRKPWQFF